jgi:hypothetical protein
MSQLRLAANYITLPGYVGYDWGHLQIVHVDRRMSPNDPPSMIGM